MKKEEQEHQLMLDTMAEAFKKYDHETITNTIKLVDQIANYVNADTIDFIDTCKVIFKRKQDEFSEKKINSDKHKTLTQNGWVHFDENNYASLEGILNYFCEEVFEQGVVWYSGGGCWLLEMEVESGLLMISDKYVCLHKSCEDFYNGGDPVHTIIIKPNTYMRSTIEAKEIMVDGIITYFAHKTED